MASTVDARVPFTSTTRSGGTGADLGIGEAARRLGIAPSAIRYYESEGLLAAPRGADGRRRYGPAQLRTLAFIVIGREMGMAVAGIRDALYPRASSWAQTVDARIAELDAQIERANRARTVLLFARECGEEAPVRDCPYMRAALDAWVAGAPLPDPTTAADDTHRSGRAGRGS